MNQDLTFMGNQFDEILEIIDQCQNPSYAGSKCGAD